jgi:hypothetical protein
MEYCDGLIDTGLARLPPASTSTKQPCYHGSVQAHQELLKQGRAMIEKMAADPLTKNVSSPVLFHPDLHKRNIFVSDRDPTIITAIIDWQPCSTEPAFYYAHETPDFAEGVPDPSGED